MANQRWSVWRVERWVGREVKVASNVTVAGVAEAVARAANEGWEPKVEKV